MLPDQLLEAKVSYDNPRQFIKIKHSGLNYIPLIGTFLERKRWRIISFLILTIVVLTALQGALMSLDSFLPSINNHLQIEKQNYQPVKYIGIPSNVTTELNQPTKIFHVTKEFGLASMSSLGHIVTGLAKAQSANSELAVNVIMPLYPFMKPHYPFRRFAQMSIDIHDKYGNWKRVNFMVHKFSWKIVENDDVLSDDQSRTPPSKSSPRAVTVFTIGPGRRMRPFNFAFKSDYVGDIYSTPPELPQEWKDLYFCKGVAELISYINNDVDTPLFVTEEERGVDVVHIHGATNALVIEFLNDLTKVNNRFNKSPPAIVYTLHDYLEEQLYSNEIVNILKFMDLKNYTEKPNYFYGERMYTSSLAIDQADYVTFVSYTTAKEMVEGPMDFYLKELIMPSILERARTGNWIGITNGIDITTLNPFDDILLIEANSNFPKNINSFNPNILVPDNFEHYYNDLVTSSKINAKKYLVTEGLLKEQDLDRVIVLFVGKFQHNKSVQYFHEAARIISQLGAKFIIMGQPNSFPAEKVVSISKEYSDDVVFINELEFQNNWGALYRAAADILFVPSITGSFGLVAVEGLLFGTPVVSSDVNVLKELLINKTNTILPTSSSSSSSPSPKPPKQSSSLFLSDDSKFNYNSYLFNLYEGDRFDLTVGEMKLALSTAINDIKELSNDIRNKEIFLRKLIKDALSLSWNRHDGPVVQYTKVYKMALGKHVNNYHLIEKHYTPTL